MKFGRRFFRPIAWSSGGIATLFLIAPVAFAQGRPSSPPDNPTAAEGDTPDPVSERLRRMEEALNQVILQNEELGRENRRLAERYDDLAKKVDGTSHDAEKGKAEGGGVAAGRSDAGGREVSGPNNAGGGSKSSGGDPTSTGRAQIEGNRHLGKLKLKGYYDWDNDGFKFATEDDEYTFGFRALTQIDARMYEQPNQEPTSSGFYVPRTRFYFEGRLTKPIQYEFSLQRALASGVDLLDAYLDFAYDDRFKVRVGRYKTPFTYEFYRTHIWDLLVPERSLFATNFEGNRRVGLMAHGELFNDTLEYAVGTFDGARNSYQPFNNNQDVMAFLNYKPFDHWEGSPLRDFNVGGSVDAGHQKNPLLPAVLRTNSPPSGLGAADGSPGNTANVPFLAFHSDVREQGFRALWELHTAYYYGGLTLTAAWQAGNEGYSRTTAGAEPVRVPISGFFAQAGYFVTGETIRDRTLVDPIHPFDLRRGRFGLGAVELAARYSTLNLDNRVFTAGLADANLWTNDVRMTDLGFNWYLNKFVKVYFDWEHAMFAQPVLYRPGSLQSTSDLFWLRFQFYY